MKVLALGLIGTLFSNVAGSNTFDREEHGQVERAEQQLTSDDVSLPTSCVGMEDGYHWMKFLEGEDFPAVYQKCSNGYVILDHSVDNNIENYFNTWSMWHVHTAGPSNDVHINWQEWFLPAGKETSLIISPDCNTCEADNARQLFSESTSYWMTGTLFGCFWAIKGAHNCDVDWDTDTCYTCSQTLQDQGSDRVAVDDSTDASDYLLTGICPHSVQLSDYYVAQTHDACAHENSAYNKKSMKPSIGVDGEYCQCFRRAEQQFISVSRHILPDAPLVVEEEEKQEPQRYFIKQEDFARGTYRITQPGVYKVMEDITFNFNSDFDYLPLEEQADDYPGAGDYRDPYFLGFFAGITIETDDVILDLNGHTLSMSEEFYFQQRWFTTIELSTQYFLPGQGIGNFGAQPQTASRVVIKDGTLGLTSHHGIHGNYNNDIRIENVIIREFETHGVQFNGFNELTMINVEVGPTSNKAFFNGEYGHMRLLLKRYQKIAEENPDEMIHFYGRENPTTMQEIADEIELQMKLAFNYVTKQQTLQESDEHYESYLSALELFVNEDGIPNGGAQYGIFLNTFGASVFTYNLYSGFFSQNAHLENIKIHGMRHEMEEYVRLHFYASGDIVINPFNAPISVEYMFEDTTDFTHPMYKGNILTDAYIASNKFSDNWGYLGLQIVLNDRMVPWAEGGDFYESLGDDEIQIGCNSDVMIHSGKGINGLRLDGVKNVYVKNLEVYDLYDTTPVGKDTCGEYDSFDALSGESGGHFRQTQPMQIGFTGNMAQAINVNAAEEVTFEDIEIRDIKSATGPAFGMSIWPACDVTLKGDINVHHLRAGKEVSKGAYDYDSLPNKAPETCALRAYYEYSDYTTTVKFDEATFSASQCVSGHVGCLGTTDRSMFGDFINDCESDEYDMSLIGSVKSVSHDNGNEKERTLAFTNALSYLPSQSTKNVLIEILAMVCVAMGVIYYKFGSSFGHGGKSVEYAPLSMGSGYGTC